MTSDPGPPDAGPPRPPDQRWHRLEPPEVLTRLESTAGGLASPEAERRLTRYGPNRLEPPEPVSVARVLADQFRSVVVLLLVGAAGAAFLLGDRLEAAAVVAVLAINTGIGFVVELRARRAMEALLHYGVPSARVVRGGESRVVAADTLVPGDVIEVESGDAVPADARILEGAELRVDEAPLTGESAPVGKQVEAVEDDAPLAERASMLWAGTVVTDGQGRGVVVGTGSATELGRIGNLLATVETGSTPLERRLDHLGTRLVWVTLAVAGVVVGTGALRGMPLGRMIETGIALAIAAVPEGLPAVATIALAVGLGRMARRNALVRRLGAVEGLGSTTVVCTDKTGTLTAGEMTVTRVVGVDLDLEISGRGYEGSGEIAAADGTAVDPDRLARILDAAALTSGATVEPGGGEVRGDPTDAALLVLARKGGLTRNRAEERFPVAGAVPFSSRTMVGASLHEGAEGPIHFVKGAPHAVLERSTRIATSSGAASLDDVLRDELAQTNEAMAGDGLRVIALARGDGAPASGEEIGELTLLALIGIVDPPAEGVPETIRTLDRAGIRTIMLTGDQRATAESIARDLGILAEGSETLDGQDVEALSADALRDRVDTVDAFSRVTPVDKLRVVTALQERGEIVAMLGDGVNDAAALKKADIGVTMGGRGTDLARQTAAIVLQDDRFPTIGAAVEEGRVIFENIRKFVFYLFSCNLAEVLVLLVAGVAGLPLPLLPLQILWLNLVTDTFPALALAMEPGEPAIMERPPRDPDAGIVSRSFIRSLVFFSVLITASTLAAFVWGMRSGDPERAVTLSFMTLALAQLFHLGNARSRGPVLAVRRALANPWAVAAVPTVLALQFATVAWAPLRRVLGTAELAPADWMYVVALSIVPAGVGQVIESSQSARAGRSGGSKS